MADTKKKQRKEFDMLLRETNKIYGKYAHFFKISDSTCWILYCLYESDYRKYTQKEFCEEWSYSRQTINSTLKKLEKEGIVFLETAEDNKSKYVNLTEKGKQTAERIIRPLIECEIEAFDSLDDKETEIFFGVMKKFNAYFEKSINDFFEKNIKNGEKQYEKQR